VRFSVIPASYVYLMKDGEVLLQQRKGTGYMDGMWVAGAAGHIELGETAAATAVREAREELGVEVRAADLRSATVMQRTDGTNNPIEQRADWFFTVSRWHGEPAVMEPHKCAAVRWFPLNALPDAVPAYERFVLDGLGSGALAAVTSHGFPDIAASRAEQG
jgi:8-oxo-dGTP pyrophosphatase MutT (NUDIX family)